MLNQPNLSDYAADERLELILAKLPPITFPKPLPPIRMRWRSQHEFETMRAHFRDALWAAQSGKCAWCCKPFSRECYATFDHVQPLSRGGRNWIGNLLLMHPACNGAKGDSSPSRELREKLEAVNVHIRVEAGCGQWFEEER